MTVLRANIAFLLATAAIALPLAGAQRADAIILAPVTLDGPSENIVGFGGVAMAPDGSGGAVYLKRVEGIAHVFVARYLGGRWLAPTRVDYAQPFAASWPRIGAAEGGQLVVVWATPFATENGIPVDELLGSTLGPGSAQFGPATLIDPDIREGLGASPDLAMSPTGKADVVYRVVFNHLSAEQLAIPILRPGDVIEDVRVAHYNGEKWSRLGPINRNPGVSMRPPSRANAPQIAIGPTGNGVVVWQEPDIEGVARIWARRLFGSTLDFVLPVSAQTFEGTPIGDDADAPTVAVSSLGQAEVAYRQSAGPGARLPGPRIFLNTLPDGESADGSKFVGASALDLHTAGGRDTVVGAPSIDVDEKQDLRLLYDSGGAPRVIEGDDLGLTGGLTLGSPFSGGEPFAASVMNPAGGGLSAWPSQDASGHEAVGVREDFPGGAVQTGLLSGGDGGPVSELAVARSGLGDGVLGFLQGPLGNAAVVVAQVTAPPAQFVLSLAKGWIKPAQALVAWQPAPSANPPLSYQVVLDGRALGTRPSGLELRLDPRRLGSGRHGVQVLATDSGGQATLTPSATLLIDGVPPSVKIARTHGRHAIAVSVSDAYSGVDTRAVGVSFGDGSGSRRRARFFHRYAHAGTYRVSVSVRSKAGNAGVVRQWVSVR